MVVCVGVADVDVLKGGLGVDVKELFAFQVVRMVEPVQALMTVSVHLVGVVLIVKHLFAFQVVRMVEPVQALTTVSVHLVGVVLIVKHPNAPLLAQLEKCVHHQIFVNLRMVLEEILTFLLTFLTTPTCVSHYKENPDLPSTL
jgi:hypothetical protein